MLQGKARIVRIRDLDQQRYDANLIDDCLCGDPPDPFDRRRIPIVFGSTKLTKPREVAMVARLEGPALISVHHRPAEPVGAVKPTNPDRVSARKRRRFDETFATRPREADARAARPAKSPTRWTDVPDVGGSNRRRALPDRFTWRGFAIGAVSGGLVGVVVLAILNGAHLL